MNLTITQITALSHLYPEITSTVGGIAYDANGNEVAYDLQAVTAKAQADAQAVINTKQNALNKLMALGLTEAEALALGVK